MTSFRKRLFTTASMLVAIGIAAYWYWSPYVVVRQMRTAAIDADADSFNDHVDYPQLRESLKGQLAARITGELASRSGSDNPFEQAGSALGGMLGLALVDRMVDTVVRPEMVMRAMENGRFQLQNGREQAQESKESAAQVDIGILSQAVKLYKLDHGVYPTEQQGLQILIDSAAGADGRGAYLEKLPVDPWGRHYQYANPGSGSDGFEIYHLSPPEAGNAPTAQKVSWQLERKGVDKVFIHVNTVDASTNRGSTTFVMRRDGFANWKLTEIRLPE